MDSQIPRCEHDPSRYDRLRTCTEGINHTTIRVRVSISCFRFPFPQRVSAAGGRLGSLRGGAARPSQVSSRATTSSVPMATEAADDEEGGGRLLGLEAPLLVPSPSDASPHRSARPAEEGSTDLSRGTVDRDARWRNRACLGAFALLDFTTNMGVSVVFPFLPQGLEAAGAGPYQRGIVFAALPFGILVVSPLVPPLLWRVGPLPLLHGGLVTITLCLVACGMWANTVAWDEPSSASCGGWGPGTNDTSPCDDVSANTTDTSCDSSDGAFRIVAAWGCARLVMGFATACTTVVVLCLITRHMPESFAFANGGVLVAEGGDRAGS